MTQSSATSHESLSLPTSYAIDTQALGKPPYLIQQQPCRTGTAPISQGMLSSSSTSLGTTYNLKTENYSPPPPLFSFNTPSYELELSKYPYITSGSHNRTVSSKL